MSLPLHIEASAKRTFEVTGLPPSQSRQFIPSDVALAAVLDATYDEMSDKDRREREHIFRYAIIALNIWARPGGHL